MTTRRALLGLVLLASAPAAAKPLYVTVPRAYGTHEAPVVDVAFEVKTPVELRVLEPENLDAFLQGQSNLRRAYTPPATQHNPGRFLAEGLNAVRNPGPFALFSLDPGFRKALSATLPKRPELHGYRAPMSRLAAGPKKLVGVPAGFSVVHRQWLNLDLGGDSRDFSVPGFEEWGGSSRFEDRRVTLAPLPAGVYVVQLVQGGIEGQVTLIVTDLNAQVKQTDGRALVRVADRERRAVAGALVTLFGPSGVTATTNADGEAWLETREQKLVLSVRRGADVAIVDTDFYSTLAIAPDVFVYSDRPIYKPGDEVHFRGLVRRPGSFLAELFSPKTRVVSVALDGVAVTTTAKVDEYGSFSGTLAVPATQEPGVLRLVATLDEQTHQAEARVQQYVKPTFYLELDSAQESIKPGDTLRAKVKARRYAGGVPKGAAYEVFLYRTLLETAAWIDDAGRGGQGSQVTYGTVSTTETALSVPKRLYSSLAVRLAQGGLEDDPWKSAARLDPKGEAELQVTVPALEPGEERLAFRYTLSVRARDAQDSEATASKSFFVADSEVAGQLAPSVRLALTGTAASLAVRAVSLGGRAYGETRGTLAVILRSPRGDERTVSEGAFTTAADGTYRAPLPTDAIGTLVLRVRLTDRLGRTWSGESTLLVASRGGEQVTQVPALTAEALGGALEPGDQAELVALFPDAWGKGGGSQGSVWITLAGTGIYSTRRLEFSGHTLVHRFAIEQHFGSAVHAQVAFPTGSGRWDERSVAFRIVPRTRVLRVEIAPEKKEAAPLGRQTLSLRVSDATGAGVRAQVSVGVVDKAIYALQAELRPGVIDFFYPLVRLNVASFYSSEFQGYGYGELLARALGRARPYDFAAIKPPTQQAKQRERDTAYWNAAIATDAAGAARVDFELPSNQTLWTVTAVAADAEGRFGEGVAEFASRGALTLSAQLPQFLRVGDEAEASVRVGRSETGAEAQSYALAVAIGGALEAKNASVEVKVGKGDEQLVPVVLVATGQAGAGVAPRQGGEGQVQVGLTGGSEPLFDRRSLPILPAYLEEPVAVSAWGGGELVLPSAAPVIGSPELVLTPTTVDAALRGIGGLLTYPYGCLEQLVSTTVPNLALYRTLERAAVLGRLDADSQALLEQARSRSVQGLQRILQLAVPGGGFTWFGGYQTPSVPLTLIALDGLAYAVEAGVVRRDEQAVVESTRWLESQTELPFSLDATRTYVLARLEGDRHSARVRALVEGAFAEKASEGDLHSLALAVLAAQHAGIAAEPALKTKLAALVAQARAGAARMTSADWRGLETDAFWRYPLRKVGLAAMLTHAASFGELDLAAARRQLVDVLARGEELSTFDKSTVLLHNLWLLERDAKTLVQMPKPTVEAGVGGSPVFTPRGFGLVATLTPETTRVRLAEFSGVAALKANVALPFASATPIGQGMTLTRQYFVVRERARKPLASGDSVKVGDEVFVELSVDARARDGQARRSAYYVVEDGIPAGFVVMQEDKTFRAPPFSLPLAHESLKARSFSPERATFFFEEPSFWSERARVFGYVMRAQFAGRFQAPPASVADMYASDVRARTSASVLVVTK